VRDRRRLGVLGSFSKKTISALKTDATANKAEVVAMAADTQARRKRKADALGEEGRTAAIVGRQDYLNSILDLPAIADNFPTLLELTKLSVVHQQE
jgi:hypothetical protein